MKQTGFIGRDDWIRTSDLFVPNEARYQAALHPEENSFGKEASPRQDSNL